MKRFRLVAALFVALVGGGVAQAAPTAPDWAAIQTSVFETATTGWYAVMPATFVGVGTILVVFWMWRTVRHLLGGGTQSA